MYNPVRGGNRGGKDQFQWEQVRTMAYQDREQYLGSTTMIGFLDKGGKWRKKDWYTHLDSLNPSSQQKTEFQRIKEQDERRMRQALGLEKPDAARDTRNLSQHEIAQMTQMIRYGQNEGLDLYDGEQHGLGFDIEQDNLQKSAIDRLVEKGDIKESDINRLEGENYDENTINQLQKEVKIIQKERKKELKQQKKKLQKQKKERQQKQKQEQQAENQSQKKLEQVEVKEVERKQQQKLQVKYDQKQKTHEQSRSRERESSTQNKGTSRAQEKQKQQKKSRARRSSSRSSSSNSSSRSQSRNNRSSSSSSDSEDLRQKQKK